MSFFSLLVAALVASSADDAVVARVDQVTITRSAIARRQDLGARIGIGLTAAEAVESLVNDALLALEARRGGIDLSSADVAAFVEAELRRAASVALVDSYVARREPEEAELRAAFHATADFVAFEFLAYASEQDARAARQRVDRGASLTAEASTAVVARLFPNGADAPQAIRAQLPAPLASILFSSKPGEIVGPVEGENGWMVARVLSKQIGSDAEYQARRPSLVASFEKQVRSATRTHLAEQVRAKSGVKLDEAFLQSLTGTVPTQEQLGHVLATVGGKPVTYAEVYPKVAALGAQASHMASPAVKIQLANAVIDERVLESFAIERGFDKRAEVAAQRPELERNALAQRLVGRIHATVKRPTGGEIEDHYRNNAARYGGKPLEKVRPNVEAAVLDEKRHDAVQARIATLRAKASVWIEPSLAKAAS